MTKDLKARKAQAEAVFNNLQNFKNEVQEKLKAFGLDNFGDIEAELARLQGEYRVLEELLTKKAEPSKVSPEADVIDVDAATEEK